jgi:hypothetical protein
VIFNQNIYAKNGSKRPYPIFHQKLEKIAESGVYNIDPRMLNHEDLHDVGLPPLQQVFGRRQVVQRRPI